MVSGSGARPADVSASGSEERLRKIFDNSNDGGFVLDPAGDAIIDANPRACQMLGYTREELLALPISAIHPTEMPKFTSFAESVLEEGNGWTDELTCLTKSGETLAAEISASAVDLDGERRLVAWVRDITDRKRADAALRESEERFRTLVENAADAIYVVAADGHIRDVNPQAVQATGYTRDELLGMHVWEIATGLSPKLLAKRVEQMATAGAVTVGGTHRRKDGSTFPVEVRSCLFLHRGEGAVLALARDVSERVKSEQERRRLSLEKGYLLEEIEMEHNFGEIVGSSEPMSEVFRAVQQVAETDSTVLITGETGTGKELIARAVHSLSTRRDKVLVKVNCAALTASLIESELFGHEKGAFTGAVGRRIGRFELGNDGTIFLDEIGDLPAELQAKLLRVLQEGEFERVGGTETTKVDVRVIAATNRDLKAAVRDGRFRSDLYYRLKVFPIHVPALRERPEDIQLLVRYFARKYGTKLGKEFEPVPPQTIEALMGYSWPGNVRELENVVERAVVLTSGATLQFDDALEMLGQTGEHSVVGSTTLEQVEREHIARTLEATHWKIEGNAGAAARLGMNPSTLRSRMRKLGIKRPD